MLQEPLPIGVNERGEIICFSESERGHAILVGGTAANRRGVLRRQAQSVQSAGIPVLMTDTHGSLAGLALQAPATLWDLQGVSGLPLRTTVTELGPLLAAHILGLNEEQANLLLVAFKVADDHGLLLIDAKDLKALLNEMAAHSQEYEEEYGSFDRKDLAAIVSRIVLLEANGSDTYLFEPAIDVHDFLKSEEAAQSRIHLLDARNQEDEKALYACYLLFLLGEFYETLPDIPDEDPLRLVILMDEAQLMLSELPDALLRRLRQLMERLPDKGISICLSVPSTTDIPSHIAGQITNCMQVIQPDQIIWSACKSKGLFSCETWEAAESIQKIDLLPLPESTALSSYERAEMIREDPLHEKYKIPFDRDSAYEFLKRRGLSPDEDAREATENVPDPGNDGSESGDAAESAADEAPDAADAAAGSESDAKSGTNDSMQKMAKRARTSAKSLGNTVAGTVGRQVGKKIGSSFGDFGETLGGNIGASLGRGIINTLFTA